MNRHKNSIVTFWAALVAGLALVGPLADEGRADFSLPDDFSATLNPNGEWSWGYSDALSSFTPMPIAGPLYGEALLPAWYAALEYDKYSPCVWKNMADTWLHQVAPGQVSLHPGNGDRMAIVRWTSPLQTELSIVGQFWAGDRGEVDVFVLETTTGGTTMLFSVLGTPSSQSFSLTTSVKAGDAIDFVVGCHDGFTCDNTPLNVDITPIPEPVSLASGAIGLACVGAYLKRRTRTR